MTTSHAVRWGMPDLFSSSSVALPQTFHMAPGSTIDITFPDGRTGTMTITGESRPGIYRGRWACAGSSYDRRYFDLSWWFMSDATVPGQPITVPVIVNVVP